MPVGFPVCVRHNDYFYPPLWETDAWARLCAGEHTEGERTTNAKNRRDLQ